jgi:4-amino-4-deoxy-L-arabinose transferase-like glycosyltransferase
MTRDGASENRPFWPWLALWTVVGLAIRLATVYGRSNRVAGGDAKFYHETARLLVAGKGFINPAYYYFHGQHHIMQTASWPPLFTFLLAIPIVFGFPTFFAARIWSCVIGAAAIVVCGLAGREIAGRRVGLIAALILAVYPNIWMTSELAMAEALSPLLAALVLWTAYRFWRRPTFGNVAWMGASIGLAALGRDELALLAVFLFLPLVLLARTCSWNKRLLMAAVGGGAAALLVLPWVGFNLSRFDRPVFISSGLGVTLASANCDTTYYGTLEGYWSAECSLKAPHGSDADESVYAGRDESYALKYIRGHEDRLLPVALARVGRGFAFFRPFQQLRLDSFVETRPYHWALLGLWMYYALLVGAIGGTVILRRRRIPVFPLWAIGLDVLVVFLVSFGNTRYRVTFEVSLVLLTAVTLDWLSAAWSRRRRRGVEQASVEQAGPETNAPVSVTA